MHFLPLIPLLLALPTTLAGISFTTPTASTKWTGGTSVVLEWDLTSPHTLASFTAYNLYLCYGSNTDPMCTTPIGSPASKMSTSSNLQIPPTAGGPSTEKVYFIKLDSIAARGGMLSVFSPRFTLQDMTGTFPAAAILAHKSLPAASPSSIDTTVKDAIDPADVRKLADVPYAEQTGKTKYAPMQKPGTKITAKTAKRQYPTSAFTIFKEMGPAPTVETTVTMAWDYEVTSKINTASPAPRVDAGQRLLMRWRD